MIKVLLFPSCVLRKRTNPLVFVNTMLLLLFSVKSPENILFVHLLPDQGKTLLCSLFLKQLPDLERKMGHKQVHNHHYHPHNVLYTARQQGKHQNKLFKLAQRNCYGQKKKFKLSLHWMVYHFLFFRCMYVGWTCLLMYHRSQTVREMSWWEEIIIIRCTRLGRSMTSSTFDKDKCICPCGVLELQFHETYKFWRCNFF